ncbi:hypothetical protein ACA910_017905 [Epithemia clementina (nom. ined.)]
MKNNTMKKSMIAPAILFDDYHHASATNTATDAAATSTTTGATKKVIVHPLVLWHILDHHSRREETTGRVIGTLLGRRYNTASTTTVVEITNAFAVPHAERGEEVAIGKDFNKRMLALFLRTNRRETVVGWYASAASGVPNAPQPPPLIADTSSLIHEFYASETDEGADPIHLVVDTRLVLGNELCLRAYQSRPVLVQGEAVGSLFHELPLQLKANEPETICLRQMIQTSNHDIDNNGNTKAEDKTATTTTTNTADALEHSMKRLYELLSTTSDFVDSTIANVESIRGPTLPNPEVGRQLADAMASVPRIRHEVLDRLFHDSLQDLLMVTYLANVTQTQITIAEQLNASLGIHSET